jgi:hypothetical protein
MVKKDVIMDKYLLALICQGNLNPDQIQTCHQAVVMTIKELQIYQTIKEHERKLRLQAEETLTKPGFWVTSTVIASTATQSIYLTGHNVLGIGTVSIKVDKDVEIGAKWAF